MKLRASQITKHKGCTTNMKTAYATYSSDYERQLYIVNINYHTGTHQRIEIPLHELQEFIEHAQTVLSCNDAKIAMGTKQQCFILDDVRPINARYQSGC